MENKKDYGWERIQNDVNGNPRYVTHFLNVLPENNDYALDEQYRIALNISRSVGGKKFHNKQYGGGIVFQSYNLDRLEKAIEKAIQEHTLEEIQKKIDQVQAISDQIDDLHEKV